MGQVSKAVRQGVPTKSAAGEGLVKGRGEGKIHVVRIDGGPADDALVYLKLDLYPAPGEAPLHATGEGQLLAEAPGPARIGLPKLRYPPFVHLGEDPTVIEGHSSFRFTTRERTEGTPFASSFALDGVRYR